MGKIVDWLLDFIYDLAVIAIGWLPDSPFQTGKIAEGLNSFADIMSGINYFVPIGSMIAITVLYLTAVLIWYGVRWILRLAQYID